VRAATEEPETPAGRSEDRDVRPLLEDRSDSWINLHDDLRPLRDGRFLWSSESTGFRHLELRARDGSLVRRLTEGDWRGR